MKLEYDGKIAIAVGKNRKDIQWNNTIMEWSVLLGMLVETTRTDETYKEYLGMKKELQDNIKDVGGFVGGTLINGRRKSDSIVKRSILTLDVDYASIDFWEGVTLLGGEYAIACYSTHKHIKDAPRLRLLIPLSRQVEPDEYEAIGRMIAKGLGIDYFDDTTYQPNRLMYWPSTSSDGEYVFDYIDAQWLDVDKVLLEYTDWKNMSEWPYSSRIQNIHKSISMKQQDPLEKDNIIGAFCRAYTVPEAIEKFIPDAYLECSVKDRYSYANGSTAAGLVIYEGDKFAYSNHSTDPAGGKLCNAFDLVRIHKFGDLDNIDKDNTPVNRLPSYKAMIEFIREDKQVKIEAITNDFSDPIKDTDWLDLLEVNKQGGPLDTINNIEIILNHDPRVCNAIGMDEFSHKYCVLQDLPWRSIERGKEWKNSDDSCFRAWLEREYRITNVRKINDAIIEVFHQNSFHPIRNYLKGITWDGVLRLDTLFIDYLGAADDEYVKAVTRKIFTAAVARVFVPGIKFDTMIILAGEQGRGKSTLLAKLGRTWFSDSIDDFKGKDALEGLQGYWIIEIPELDAMKKSEVETVKKFLSKTNDIFRPAYGKRSEEFKRQCIFFGTTNSMEFLKDKTGNRRFWPINIFDGKNTKDVFKDLDNEVDQIWAEAKYYFEQGEILYLDDEKIAGKAREVQKMHMEQDPRIGQIQEYLDMKLPINWEKMNLEDRRFYIHTSNREFGEPEEFIIRSKVCAIEIWCELFKGDINSKSGYEAREINAILFQIEGWSKAKSALRFPLYGAQKAFKRVSELETKYETK